MASPVTGSPDAQLLLRNGLRCRAATAKDVSAGGDRAAGGAPSADSPGCPVLRVRFRELAGERWRFSYRRLGSPI